MSLGGKAFAKDVVVYSIDCTKNSSTNNAYASAADITIGDITWNVPGNSSLTTGWRIGGKSLSGKVFSIYSKQALEESVDKVVLSNGTNSLTLDSLTLNVYSTAALAAAGGDGDVSSVSGEFAAESTTTFNKPEGVDWTDRYYGITYKVTVSGTSNKFVQLLKAEFSRYEAGINAPTFNKEEGVYTTAQNVKLSADEGLSIYYTINGSDPTVESNQIDYNKEAGIDVTETTTIKAVAYDATNKIYSEVVSITITIKKTPNAGWTSDTETESLGMDVINTYTTNSDATVVYESSHPEVATVAADGTITTQGYGLTVITASTAATSNYEASSSNFTLVVKGDGIDVITQSKLNISGTGYKDWSKTFEVGPTYSGNSAVATGFIQLRAKDGAGIVTTSSDMAVKSITVGYNATTVKDRTLNIYGNYSAYTSTTDLYDDAKKGTLVGTAVKSTDTGTTSSYSKVSFEEPYLYIGLCSADGALYCDYIVVEYLEAGYTRDVTEGNYGTICLAQNATVTGADVFEIAGTRLKEGEVSGIVLEAVESLEAGKAYIFQATGAKLSAFMTGTAVTAAATDGAIVGNLSDESVNVANGNYVISQNKIRKVNGGTATVAKNRAYLNLSGVAEYQEPSETTTKRTVELDVAGSTTAISEINADVNNSVMFDLSGRRVNKMDKGIYIVNGKKVIVR